MVIVNFKGPIKLFEESQSWLHEIASNQQPFKILNFIIIIFYVSIICKIIVFYCYN